MPLDPEDVALLKQLQAEQRASKKAERAEKEEDADDRNTDRDSGADDHLAPGYRWVDRRASGGARSDPAPSTFSILIVAGIIALLSIIGNRFGEGAFLALLVYVVLGSIAPIVFLPIGLVVIVYLFYKGAAQELFNWIKSLTTAQPVMAPKAEPVIPEKTFTAPGPGGSVQVIPNKTFGG